MTTFKITPRAKKSLMDIGRYTQEKWGKQQRNHYLRNLNNRFQWLAENPKMGKHRHDVGEGYYCYRQQEHIIFYLILDGCIAIIGVPHTAMDVQHYFD
jgi:toxin ParE1/3/4